MDGHPCTFLTGKFLFATPCVGLGGIIGLMASPSIEKLLSEGAEAAFSGWDFSWLDGRMIETAPPWDYGQEARRLLAGSRRALDLDTGGGEALADLGPFAGRVVATEG